jgi:hypothetical protein
MWPSDNTIPIITLSTSIGNLTILNWYLVYFIFVVKINYFPIIKTCY